MSDLRNEIDANYYFGEIKMWEDSPFRKNRVGVIVEAKAEEKLFGKFFKKDCLFFCFQGWEKVVATIKQVNQYTIKGVFGIIDADFKRIEKIEPTDDNLFLTDYHDTEMMLIESDAWNHVLHHYADTSISTKKTVSKLDAFEQKKGEPIKETLLKLATQIAYIRLFDKRFKPPLTFRIQKKKGKYEYIDYHKFVDPKTLNLNQKKLLKIVENKSSKPNFFAKSPNKERLETIQQEVFDVLEFCNGHDVCNLLSLALEEAIASKASSKKVAGETIEANLVMNYRLEDFQKTQLYKALKNWEKSHFPPYQLFNI